MSKTCLTCSIYQLVFLTCRDWWCRFSVSKKNYLSCYHYTCIQLTLICQMLNWKRKWFPYNKFCNSKNNTVFSLYGPWSTSFKSNLNIIPNYITTVSRNWTVCCRTLIGGGCWSILAGKWLGIFLMDRLLNGILT